MLKLLIMSICNSFQKNLFTYSAGNPTVPNDFESFKAFRHSSVETFPSHIC